MTMLDAIARRLLPATTYRRMKFANVYRNHVWGKDHHVFNSGAGSRGRPVDVYVDAVVAEMGKPNTIVDLGCGDFSVGMALTKLLPNARYIGCDIVPALIEHHQRENATDRISFRMLDIVSGEIPAGDAHLTRQVFQHLPNNNIRRVLRKLRNSPCLIVTEGQPLAKTGPTNPDKSASGYVRYNTSTGEGSGVELDKPPSNLTLRELCRVEMPGSEQIVTWRVTHEGTQ